MRLPRMSDDQRAYITDSQLATAVLARAHAHVTPRLAFTIVFVIYFQSMK